jgi:hypothetical protein
MPGGGSTRTRSPVRRTAASAPTGRRSWASGSSSPTRPRRAAAWCACGWRATACCLVGRRSRCCAASWRSDPSGEGSARLTLAVPATYHHCWPMVAADR